ncbi:hypothetical protein BDQ12DRAFT_719196 [Crucibulum laeve]|uniref:Uncharacterized protein n=1 Tax=Crucibulum laeve TaxID=68775 RepID=A0A5C3MAI1_9AGAR|nr:hypothetical protein BDQ12DRAFT_719196 [Crucibulum laeve]
MYPSLDTQRLILRLQLSLASSSSSACTALPGAPGPTSSSTPPQHITPSYYNSVVTRKSTTHASYYTGGKSQLCHDSSLIRIDMIVPMRVLAGILAHDT